MLCCGGLFTARDRIVRGVAWRWGQTRCDGEQRGGVRGWAFIVVAMNEPPGNEGVAGGRVACGRQVERLQRKIVQERGSIQQGFSEAREVRRWGGRTRVPRQEGSVPVCVVCSVQNGACAGVWHRLCASVCSAEGNRV